MKAMNKNFRTAAAALGAALAVSAAAPAAAPAAEPVLVRVSAGCADGEAMFQVQNVGGAWPKVGTISVYRVRGEDRLAVNKRVMRLADGQYASFKVKTAGIGSDSLALYVDPSWYGRAFAYDAAVTCG